jgi:hypothetical protein
VGNRRNDIYLGGVYPMMRLSLSLGIVARISDGSASVHHVCDQSLADISRQSRIPQPPKTATNEEISTV